MKKGKILVVDDNEDVLLSLNMLLKPHVEDAFAQFIGESPVMLEIKQQVRRAAVDDLCGFAIHRMEDLAVVNKDLPGQMRGLRTGEQKLVQLTVKSHDGKQGEEKMEVVMSVVNFFHRGFAYRLYTLQNVQPVIQKSETDAQQQLVRVLTHEIMNSLTPIISLSDTLCDGIQQGTLSQDDVLMALQAIHRRSNGLLQFVENYRKLQHISQPLYADVRVGIAVSPSSWDGRSLPLAMERGARCKSTPLPVPSFPILPHPKIILADEPTGNLDSRNGKEVMELLSELHKEGTTIVMVTHSLHDANYADRIINMFDGEIVSQVEM